MFKKKEENNDKIILRKAIDIAEKNGYKGHLRFLSIFIKTVDGKKPSKKQLDNLVNDIFYHHRNNIILAPSFAKAFWFGKEQITRDVYKDWIYHAKKLRASKNPIKYLEEFIEK